MDATPSTPLPLEARIELAEAFIELTWAGIPKARSGVIQEARWRAANAGALESIDFMLDKLLALYDERALAQHVA